MLTSLYTTKMSASKKQLQARFTKIRSRRTSKVMSAVTAIFIAAAMLAATVVFAAAEVNGLEHWEKNEAYFLAGITGKANFAPQNSPEWLKSVSDNGKVGVFVKRTDIRETSGLVSHLKTVTLSGNVGKMDFIQKSSCGYYGKNGEELLVVFDTVEAEGNPYGAVNPEKVYIKALDAGEYAENSGLDYKDFMQSSDFYGFIPLTSTRVIGNFTGIENEYHNSICVNYYTHFESIFNNKHVDGIELEVSKACEDFVAVTANVDVPEACYMQVSICEPDEVPCTGTSRRYKLSEVNGTEMRFSNIFRKDGFEKGKTYTVNFVLSDEEDSVVYRQQDYVIVE